MTPTIHPALLAAADAAGEALLAARAHHSNAELAEQTAVGADGTPTSRLDLLVEDAICRALEPFHLNIISEELGSIDVGASVTLVLDPVDGTANAVAGVPICGFAGAIAVEGRFTEALTEWLDTGQRWWVHREAPTALRTTGRCTLDGAAIDLLRPDARNVKAWNNIAARAERVRILSCSSIESVLVAQGSIDAFADAGSDRQRLCDLAAAVVTVERAGGVVVDAFGRDIEPHPDLTRRFSGVVAASRQLADEIIAVITA